MESLNGILALLDNPTETLLPRSITKVLFGAFEVEPTDLWYAPASILRIYVSAIESDTQEELKILFQDILPNVLEQGWRNGVEVQMMDTRITAETSDNVALTWREREEELWRCKTKSVGLNFVSLLCDT